MLLIAHDMTQEPSRHGIAEHHDIDKLVKELEKNDVTSPCWLALAKALHHKVFLPENSRFQVPFRPPSQ